MRVGDKIGGLRPYCDSDVKETRAPRPATVTYIHPAGRFYVVEFDLPGGKCREAFLMRGGAK